VYEYLVYFFNASGLGRNAGCGVITNFPIRDNKVHFIYIHIFIYAIYLYCFTAGTSPLGLHFFPLGDRRKMLLATIREKLIQALASQRSSSSYESTLKHNCVWC